MSGLRIIFSGFSPSGAGGDTLDVATPADLTAWDALTPTNGFVHVVTKPDSNGNTETQAINQASVNRVIALP